MALKRPFFVLLSEKTLKALILSVFIAAFALAVALFVPPSVASILKGRSDFIELLSLFVFFVPLATAFAILPAGLLGLPVISFLKAQSAFNLWTCLLSGLIAGLPWPLLIANDNIHNFLILVWPSLLGAFVFHRLDQGFWFAKSFEMKR